MPTTKHDENTQKTGMGKKDHMKKMAGAPPVYSAPGKPMPAGYFPGHPPEASPCLANIVNHHIGMWPTDESRGLASFCLLGYYPQFLQQMSHQISKVSEPLEGPIL